MAGTKEGSQKAVKTIRERNPNFFKEIGQKGGQASRGGGFAYGEEGRERARVAGSKGGAISKRGPDKLYDFRGEMMSIRQIAEKLGVSRATARVRLTEWEMENER